MAAPLRLFPNAPARLAAFLLSLGLWLAADAVAQPLAGPLRVNPSNPRYFTDGTGRSVYLTGSHEWLNLVDGGRTDPPQRRNYGQLMHFMRSYNHNFHRLWAWELLSRRLWPQLLSNRMKEIL